MKAPFLALLLLLTVPAGAGAQTAGAGNTVLDVDRLSVTHDPDFESWAQLTLMRSPTGQALLQDLRPGRSLRVTRLGFSVPASGVAASYAELPDGRVWMTILTSTEGRVVDLGDLAAPQLSNTRVASFGFGASALGGHAPRLVEPESDAARVAIDPRSVQLGIIAILIGLAVEPVPGFQACSADACAQFAFDGSGFRTAGFMEEEGIYFFLTEPAAAAPAASTPALFDIRDASR